MDEPKNANDGRSNGALFSSIVGDSMQQAVLCSYRCTLEVLPNPSTHTEGHVKCQSEYWKAQCGESRMLRLDGGKGRKALPIRITLEVPILLWLSLMVLISMVPILL